MPKKLEKYEQFVENLNIDRRFKFEENIIDPILTLIRENQEYLTQPENLPQLAKLGWMYNTLWYAGRVCWGYDGFLIDPSIIKDLKTADEGDMDEDDENYPYRFQFFKEKSLKIYKIFTVLKFSLTSNNKRQKQQYN